MRKQFLLPSHGSRIEHNIYADRSSLVLEWLLLKGIEKEYFSIREIVREQNISLGLVQRVFDELVYEGYLHVTGIHTGKKFSLKKPQNLLKSWLEHYSIVKKCKMWSYRSGFSNREKILEALEEAKLPVTLALHSAAHALGYKNTNLQTVELYLATPKLRLETEKCLLLEPKERGYEVLLIAPYYKSIVRESREKEMARPSQLLTFLDLYHFPLRGQEQAESMIQRSKDLQRIYKRD